MITISWGLASKRKYLTFVFGKDWDKKHFKFLDFYKTFLGWGFNLWRFGINYDNWGNHKKKYKRKFRHE